MPGQPVDVVICEPLRTPIGRFGGALAGQTPAALAAHVLSAVVARTGIDPGRVDEVILGHAYPTSEAPAIGRVAALDAGLPDTVTGIQIDRRCGSGLQAVLDAAMQIRAGFSEVVLAGGAEVMSAAPYYTHEGRWGIKGPGLQLHDSLARGRATAGGVHHPIPGGMIETAENLRREYGISREDQDALALASQQRAPARSRTGCSPRRSSRSRCRPARAGRSSRPTSTRDRTPPRRAWRS